MEIRWHRGTPEKTDEYLVKTIDRQVLVLIYDAKSKVWGDDYGVVPDDFADRIEYFISLDEITDYLNENTD